MKIANKQKSYEGLNDKLRGLKFKLAISYNNGAIEFEYLGDIEGAMSYFQKAD